MKKFLLLASLALCFVKAYPQFTNCYSFVDYFEEIYTITTDGEHVYVGTDKTIHRSPDNGLNWAIMTGCWRQPSLFRKVQGYPGRWFRYLCRK
jgi:hypothetical protein